MPMPSSSTPETDRALDAALALSRARGRVLTPMRRAVLGLLLATDRPTRAYALLEQLRATHPKVAPPTVYRALAFLAEEGLVHRIERLNAFIAEGDLLVRHDAGPTAGQSQFLICDHCGHAAQLHDPAVAEALALVMNRAGFLMRETTIELQGICAACSGSGTPGGTTARHAGS